jgi:Fe-S cluster assembly ATP-binding protein
LSNALLGIGGYGSLEGEIVLEGENILGKAPHEIARRGIALGFQEPARFENITVQEYLEASFLNLQKGKKGAGDDHSSGSRRKEKLAQIKDNLELVGLREEFLRRRLDESLSGGERKRIELASVITMRPKLMVLDEPDASLDIIVYNELYDLMLKIKERLGCSILLITHREEAGLIADQATLLEGGKVLARGRFRSVMRTYCRREGAEERCRLGGQQTKS